MKRKTVKVSGIIHTVGKAVVIGGSLCITLPELWVTENKIKAGDCFVKVGDMFGMLVIKKMDS